MAHCAVVPGDGHQEWNPKERVGLGGHHRDVRLAEQGGLTLRLAHEDGEHTVGGRLQAAGEGMDQVQFVPFADGKEGVRGGGPANLEGQDLELERVVFRIRGHEQADESLGALRRDGKGLMGQLRRLVHVQQGDGDADVRRP